MGTFRHLLTALLAPWTGYWGAHWKQESCRLVPGKAPALMLLCQPPVCRVLGWERHQMLFLRLSWTYCSLRADSFPGTSREKLRGSSEKVLQLARLREESSGGRTLAHCLSCLPLHLEPQPGVRLLQVSRGLRQGPDFRPQEPRAWRPGLASKSAMVGGVCTVSPHLGQNETI